MTRFEESHESAGRDDRVYDSGTHDDERMGDEMEMMSLHSAGTPSHGSERALSPVEPSKRAVIYARVSTKAQAERHGNPEGYSLPTQRLAGRIRAEELGAVVVDEYVDKDSGTRVDKRPAMLALIERVETKRDVDYVIVHQLSRFARNRLDDASITQRLEDAGAVLISCLEGIDRTPSGRMLQGVLASLNEYQSTNQSEDIKRKTLQKVKDGGTPSLAPIGYRNVQGAEADKNLRWVEIDPERAPHIVSAFNAYATGKYSTRRLAQILEERGLTQRPTKTRPERPLAANKLQTVLRNRYYTGVVTFKGIDYEGKHPRLIDQVTFDKVQQLLDAHRQSGERAHRHTHYLKGTLRCARCKSRLAYCFSRGNGGSYAYFFCLGRHHRRTSCDLPHLNPDLVEAAIVDYYQGDQLQPEELERLRTLVLEDLAQAEKRSDSERKRLIARITTIRQTRYQWAEKAMAGTVPDDIIREKQQQLSGQLARAETDLACLDQITADSRADLERIFDLAREASRSYRISSDDIRKEWNFSLYDALDIDVEDWEPFVSSAQRTPTFEAIHTARAIPGTYRRQRGTPSGRFRTTPIMSVVDGSTVPLLVEVSGLEPPTSTLRTWISPQWPHFDVRPHTIIAGQSG